ncbi:unnamed protein product [Arabis nemorensis]|uniref:Uncharacterized protein n=1 Tax=Arabis nemorensis TaxID=586526 RepID=A0A565BJZ8_9BRAS|nr:unnamed protein product [Arabis nemorensis]
MSKDEEEMIGMDIETMGKLREICSCVCRECIYGKIAQGDFKCCPICYNDVGPNPASKLRLAHGWDKIKDLYFKEQENEEMEQESTEGLETKSSVPSSTDMEDVKPLVPIKAEEDDKIELPSVSQNGVVAGIAVKLERDNDLMTVGPVATSSGVKRKAIAPVIKDETQG